MGDFLWSTTTQTRCVTSSATYGMILADNLIDETDLELFMLGLIRVAVIVLIALLVYRLLKRWLATLPQKSNKTPDKIGRMVRCHYCNLHIPESEAFHGPNGWYCSEEHRKLDRPVD